jgi:hypothetical protein
MRNLLSNPFKVCLFVFVILGSTKSFAQTFPSASSCTSKDLELVSATLPVNPGENACTCGGTRTLQLAIANKTGSTRTSFAFWGSLEITHTDGTTTTTSINGCNGPIIKNTTTTLPFNQITFACGESIRLIDLFLAWTSASPGEVCPLNSATINPKCGTLPAIVVNAGLTFTAPPTGASCAGNDGSILVSPSGGTPNYSVACTGKTTQTGIGAGSSANFTGLTPGSYTITVTDANNCTATVSRTVTGSSIPTPAATVTTQPTCTTATGTVTVTSADAGTTYKLFQGATLKYTASSGVFTGVDPGTYTLKAEKGQCGSTGNNVTVNTQPVAPTFTVCLVQPTLCSTGSLHVNTPTGGTAPFTYQRNALTAQTTKDFTGLGAASVTSITVTNSEGCATTVLCANLVLDCPVAGRVATSTIVSKESTSETTVKAYPNPFSDRVKFMVTSSDAGYGNLDVYNMMGQKVKTVYTGFIAAGTQTFELSLPTHQVSNLVYVLRVGDKKVTGKILQINQ